MSEVGMKGLECEKREEPSDPLVVVSFIHSSFLAHTFSAPNYPLGFLLFRALLSLP